MGGHGGGGGRSGRGGGGGGSVTPSESIPASASPGLDQIRSQIQSEGGAEAFLDNMKNKSLKAEDRPPMASEQMGRIWRLYSDPSDFKKPYKTEGNTKYYTNADKSIVMAKVKGKPAAYALKADGYTTIVTAKEHGGKGLGKKVVKDFYNYNPDMVKKTGGTTPAGRKALLSVFKDIEAGNY